MNGANTGQALNGIASAFMDTGQQALRQQALAAAQQKQAAIGQVANAFQSLGQGQPVDYGMLGASALAAGVDPSHLTGYTGAIGSLSGNQPLADASLYSQGKYTSSLPGIQQQQGHELRKQQQQGDISARNEALARGDALVDGFVNGQPVKIRQADALKTPGFQPALGTDAYKGQGLANAGAIPGVGGSNPQVDESGNPKPLSDTQSVALGITSNKEPTVQNYVVRTPQGIVTGRTADGKTDLMTGKPLDQSAQLVSSSNQGGIGGFVPGQTEQSNLRRDYTNARSLAAGASQIADLVDRNPSLVGFTGNMARTAQSVIGQGQTLAKALGFNNPEQAGRAALATIAKSVDLNSPDVQKSMDPQFLMNLTDPNVHAIDRMHAVVTALAAPILFPGNSQYMYSKDAMNRVRSVIGDPNSWLQDPKAYSAGMRRLSDIAKQQAESSAAQLETGDVRSGSPLNINPGQPSGQNPAGNSPGGAPALTYVPGKGFQ